jgi:hypothetical protein
MPRRNRNTRRKQQGRRSNLAPHRDRDPIGRLLNEVRRAKSAGEAFTSEPSLEGERDMPVAPMD